MSSKRESRVSRKRSAWVRANDGLPHVYEDIWPAIYGELRKDLDLSDVTKVQKYGLTRFSGGSDIAF
jgi:hypothetical protein